MKKGITINICNYENLHYDTNEHNHGDIKIDIYECNKELYEMIKDDIKMFPELTDKLKIFEQLIKI